MKIAGFGRAQKPRPEHRNPKISKRQNLIAGGPKRRYDKVELSKSSKATVNTGHYNNIRKGKLAARHTAKDLAGIRDRLAKADYSSTKIGQKTSNKLIDSRELGDVVGQYHRSKSGNKISVKPSYVRHERIAEVQKKIAEGFYDDPGNFGCIADKIIVHYFKP